MSGFERRIKEWVKGVRRPPPTRIRPSTSWQYQSPAQHVPHKDCIICYDNLDFIQFPDRRNHLSIHDICINCARRYLDDKIFSESAVEIICPNGNCESLFEYDEIQALASPEAFSRYDELLCLKLYQEDPNFRWCTNRHCGAGQIIIDGDSTSYFSCFRCEFRTCFSCQTPFHSGYTCEQHKASLLERQFSEVRSAEWLNANAKLCRCGKWVQKTEGCDHMTCRCGAEWCWICGASYDQIKAIGNTAHRRSCIHYQ